MKTGILLVFCVFMMVFASVPAYAAESASDESPARKEDPKKAQEIYFFNYGKYVGYYLNIAKIIDEKRSTLNAEKIYEIFNRCGTDLEYYREKTGYPKDKKLIDELPIAHKSSTTYMIIATDPILKLMTSALQEEALDFATGGLAKLDGSDGTFDISGALRPDSLFQQFYLGFAAGLIVAESESGTYLKKPESQAAKRKLQSVIPVPIGDPKEKGPGNWQMSISNDAIEKEEAFYALIEDNRQLLTDKFAEDVESNALSLWNLFEEYEKELI